jgi:predicted DNA-binding transcriptional regulator YafY
MGGTVEPIDEHTCEYRAGDDHLDWLAVRILMLGAEIEVHEPPELRERMAELGARMSRAVN